MLAIIYSASETVEEYRTFDIIIKIMAGSEWFGINFTLYPIVVAT